MTIDKDPTTAALSTAHQHTTAMLKSLPLVDPYIKMLQRILANQEAIMEALTLVCNHLERAYRASSK